MLTSSTKLVRKLAIVPITSSGELTDFSHSNEFGGIFAPFFFYCLLHCISKNCLFKTVVIS